MTSTTRRRLPTLHRVGLTALAAATIGAIGVLAGPATADSGNAPTQLVAANTPASSALVDPAAAPAAVDPAAAPAPAPAAPAAAAPAPAAPAPAAPPARLPRRLRLPRLRAAPAPPAEMVLNNRLELQINGYYCGPAATRNALSAMGKDYGQDVMAQQLGTTVNGTDNIRQITGLLNREVGEGRYAAYDIPGPKATDAWTQKLQADLVAAISQGKPVVANIAGVAIDDAGEVHSYKGGHYIAVVGYSNNGATALIADSADTVGSPSYHIGTDRLADWIASRGYTA